MAEPEIRGNKNVEDAAVTFVIDFERAQGRSARDTRHLGAPADLESSDRIIEVKAASLSARGQDLWLEVRQVEEARTNPNFYVYLVDNVRQGNPAQFGLVILEGDTLAALLTRAKEQRYYSVPFPVAIYEESKVDRKATFREPSPRQPPTLPAMTRLAAITRVLEARGGPMTIAEVTEALPEWGHSAPRSEVGTDLAELAQQGRVVRVARGTYEALRPPKDQATAPEPPSEGQADQPFATHDEGDERTDEATLSRLRSGLRRLLGMVSRRPRV